MRKKTIAKCCKQNSDLVDLEVLFIGQCILITNIQYIFCDNIIYLIIKVSRYENYGKYLRGKAHKDYKH